MKFFGPNEKIVASARPVWQENFAAMVKAHKNVVALTADLSRSTCTELARKETPERFFNVGIAEQNMLGLAAGLALSGKVPYCATFAPFATLRAGEQFRNDVCYMNLNVRLIGSYGGIVAPAGPTHSGLEDLGVIRSIPNTTIVSPSDLGMVAKVFEASVDYPGPVYIRLETGSNEPILYAEDYEYKIGKAIVAKEGKDATIISLGMILRNALEAAQKLAEEGIDVGIIDMHTLKPLDAEAVVQAARRTGRVITMERHTINNGLGSAVAETILESGVPCKFKRLGIPNLFPVYGDPDKLAVKYGFGTDAAVAAIKAMM
jgi:transketolase